MVMVCIQSYLQKLIFCFYVFCVFILCWVFESYGF